MRAVILVLGALALSNCAAVAVVPAAVTYASTAASVVSYVATGKGASDHVISAFSERDCALHRAFTAAGICSPEIPPLLLTDATDILTE